MQSLISKLNEHPPVEEERAWFETYVPTKNSLDTKAPTKTNASIATTDEEKALNDHHQHHEQDSNIAKGESTAISISSASTSIYIYTIAVILNVVAFIANFLSFQERRSIPLPPWLYAAFAPGMTVTFLVQLLQTAPLKWPGLRRVGFMRRGTVAVLALWVAWSWGVWEAVRRW